MSAIIAAEMVPVVGQGDNFRGYHPQLPVQFMAGSLPGPLNGIYRAFDKLMPRLWMGKGQYFVASLVLCDYHGAGFFYWADLAV